MAQMARPTSQRRRPRPSAPASVPLRMARARRAAEQDRLGQRPVDRHGEARHVFGRPAIRPAPRRRTRRTTGRSSTRRRRSTGRTRSGGGSRRTSPNASVRPVR
jgi:hypothetical protein